MHVCRPALATLSALCACLISAAAPSAALAARHHHHQDASTTANSGSSSPRKHHHHTDQTASSAQPAPHHHLSRSALLKQVQQQEEQLYALRHERNVLSQRSKHLAKLVHTRKHAHNATQHTSGKRHKRADAELTRAQQRHEQKLAKLQHLHNLHEQKIAARESRSQRAHLARLAALQAVTDHARAKQRAHMAAAQSHHDQRVAALQAKADRIRAEQEQRVAAAEARREQRKDKQSGAVHIATGSGLPIWQGSAYAAQVPVKLVTVNLNDPRVKVSALLARNGIGSSEAFTHMVSRTHPYVAVTGTFFSLDNLRPVGDIVINGELAYFGGMGTALAITGSNRADMVTVPWGHHHNWSGYDTVVACGPRLLRNGDIVLDPHMEHFKDRHMLSPNSRIAVGITNNNQLVFAMTREPIYLGRLAKIMRSLGCRQAMNLDAGTSTGFYCNGRYMARPGRWLTNAIVVYSDRRPHDTQSAAAVITEPRIPEHIVQVRTASLR